MTREEYQKEKRKREAEIARKKQKEREKRQCYENSIDTIGYSSTCRKIEKHCLNIEIFGVKDLKKVIDSTDGDCFFYFSCTKRKPECGYKIKRSLNIFKDV